MRTRWLWIGIALFLMTGNAYLLADDLSTDALEGVQLTGRSGTEYTDLINLLIERGRVTPVQTLLSLTTTEKIRLRIVGPALLSIPSDTEGNAFVSEVAYEMDRVVLPRVVPGSLESDLYVEIEGEQPWDPILIRMVDEGHIRRILKTHLFADIGLRADAEWGFALLDGAKIDPDKLDWDQLRKDWLDSGGGERLR